MIRKILHFMFIAFACSAISSLAATAHGAVVEGQKAVLVTGASTGIGRKITEVFAAQGYFVYAGARKQKDIDSLNRIDNVMALKLDVTVQAQIDAAVTTVKQEGRGLWGLINNAGVYIGGPLADVDIEEFKWLMDVNVNGVYRVTQAFAPLIIASQGRISTIGSISGTGSGPFNGPYSMSKHAIEAYTDSLAAEMALVGVKVSVIEPGNYASAIRNSAQVRMTQKMDAYARQGSPFAGAYSEWMSGAQGTGSLKESDEVAAAALHAMFSDAPLLRYMVVPDEGNAAWAIDKQIEELVQLNQWQAYSYSRDALIAKLDAVMAADDDVEKITALLHAFLAGSGEASAHERFWANDLVYTSSDGTRTSKSEILQDLAAEPENDNASASRYHGEDIKVQLLGSTAVVTFTLVGTPGDGAAPLYYFNTGTFIQRDGEWRVIAWQATKVG
jgi:NAD(P)-dependent dehydrogenase (short-subunit alcohol dehydrogenase family)